MTIAGDLIFETLQILAKTKGGTLGLQVLVSRDKVESFLKTQKALSELGENCVMDLGFHYTQSQNIDKIKKWGLMVPKDRNAKGVTSARRHGDMFGEGIYSGNNPFSFQAYGETGVIVARIHPKTVKYGATRSHSSDLPGGFEKFTETGNKYTAKDRALLFEEVVATESWQILPLLSYDRDVILPWCCKESDVKLLYDVRDELQECLACNILGRQVTTKLFDRVTTKYFLERVGYWDNMFTRFQSKMTEWKLQQEAEATRQRLEKQRLAQLESVQNAARQGRQPDHPPQRETTDTLRCLPRLLRTLSCCFRKQPDGGD